MSEAKNNPIKPNSTAAGLKSHQAAFKSVKLLALIGCFSLISATYFFAAITRSSVNHLWMDEISTELIAKQSSLAGIWSAIWNGLEFSPPTYHILLHYFIKAVGTGDDLLIWRIPSIVAIYCAALCVYALVRHRLNPFVALLAFGIVLDSELFEQAVQVRQYGLLTLGLAASFLLWYEFQDTRFPKTYSFTLWFILSGCLSLHFYGTIEVAAIGVAEVIWWISRKQFRLGIWLPLIFTIPIEAALFPLASHLATFNTADTMAANYYGKPTLFNFTHALFDIILGGKIGTVLLFTALALSGIAYALQCSTLRHLVHEDMPERDNPNFSLDRLEIVILALCTLPFITFALAFFVTKSFAGRYAIPAALISGIAAAYILNKLPSRRVVALALIPFILGTLIIRSHEPDPITDVLTALATPRQPLPVVIGEGRLYVELMEAVDAKTRLTLVYLLNPPDSISPDPTNENIVKRLTPFVPEYRVSKQVEFLSTNPRFYVLSRLNFSTDTTTPSLIKKGLIGGPLDIVQDTILFYAGSASKP
jgi:hypothetical protein